jgi:tryptophan 2,3-dioxygenase
VITASAFLDAMEYAGVRDQLAAAVRTAATASPAEIEELAAKSRRLIETAGVPDYLMHGILDAYQALVGDRATLAVAVRSSATAEDTADTSFAGMNVSFTNVTRDDLVVEWDERITMWRIRHYKVVARIIGDQVVGTQGTPVEVLGKMIHHNFFPALWRARNQLTARAKEEED